MNATNNLVTKVIITKSKSGHYTLTIRLVGEWNPEGTDHWYPYSEVIYKEVKLNSIESARNHAADFLNGL